jgi:hypothetical protein
LAASNFLQKSGERCANPANEIISKAAVNNGDFFISDNGFLLTDAKQSLFAGITKLIC